MMILPAVAVWPPKSLTPRRLLLLSLPLSLLPTPFLCAIVSGLYIDYLKLYCNAVNPDLCITLAMSFFDFIAFSPLFLENDHFIAFYMTNDACTNRSISK